MMQLQSEMKKSDRVQDAEEKEDESDAGAT
jgi:hypothetical protein